MDIPLIHKFKTGYEEGARSVNPGIRLIDNYVGVTDAAWNNPGKGKELAVAQINKGADVIFTAAGNSGLGAFDAAEQYDKFVIGVDSNQNWVKPGHVLTSMVKRIDNAIYQTVKDQVEGNFRAGIQVFGLENDGVGYAIDRYNQALIPSEIISEVEAAKRKIISGEIQVTDAMAK
ncbi:MAG: BMP family ABC transporter substrate-binding protein [Pyrinomonadaceae bacterium]